MDARDAGFQIFVGVGKGQAGVAGQAKGAARNDGDAGVFQKPTTKCGVTVKAALRDGCGHVGKHIEGAIRHRASHAGHGVQPGTQVIGLEKIPKGEY